MNDCKVEVEVKASCGGCGSKEHGTRRRREVGEVEVEEGRVVLRISGFILFRCILIGASSVATGAAVAVTAMAKATTIEEPIAGLLRDVQEGGGPFPGDVEGPPEVPTLSWLCCHLFSCFRS